MSKKLEGCSAGEGDVIVKGLTRIWRVGYPLVEYIGSQPGVPPISRYMSSSRMVSWTTGRLESGSGNGARELTVSRLPRGSL
jgi:hypothetical protein